VSQRGGYIPYGRDGHTATRGKGHGGAGSTELSPASQAALAKALDTIDRAFGSRRPTTRREGPDAAD
jgi:hypothetical protein